MPDDRDRTPPPDPRAAGDLAQFVEKLAELRTWAARPGQPPGWKKLEQMARDHPEIRHGVLSSSTMHRILSGQQDLAFARDPVRFVDAFVRLFEVDSTPWVQTVRDLLHKPEETEPEPAGRLRRPRRRMLVVAALVVVAVAVAVTWIVLDGASGSPRAIDYSRPVVIDAEDLRLAIDQATDESGSRGVVLDQADAGAASWEFAAPYRLNPEFRQLRPQGRLLMCLEVNGGSFDERAAVQQWGCNGEPHQYWRTVHGDEDTVRFVNLNSGQCLSVAGNSPQAGMQLVQRECDEQHPGQQWLVTAAERMATPTVPPVVGPDPAEYPGGGKDQPCQGPLQGIPVDATPWSKPPFLIRNEDATRGKAFLGTSTSGAVELLRADRIGPSGKPESFYWAEGFVKFTPRQFEMALQWTTLPGSGGWHTCAITPTTEHSRPQTPAFPRDIEPDGIRDVWFRVCLSYRPEHRGDARVTHCTSRY
jgi:Ricin-type beta-trefoil lectin domain